jgi:hypothetical protein
MQSPNQCDGDKPAATAPQSPGTVSIVNSRRSCPCRSWPRLLWTRWFRDGPSFERERSCDQPQGHRRLSDSDLPLDFGTCRHSAAAAGCLSESSCRIFQHLATEGRRQQILLVAAVESHHAWSGSRSSSLVHAPDTVLSSRSRYRLLHAQHPQGGTARFERYA